MGSPGSRRPSFGVAHGAERPELFQSVAALGEFQHALERRPRNHSLTEAGRRPVSCIEWT